jgi:hypothetical protein
MPQLESYDARFQASLSTYFRLQSELKELLVNRKRNYSSRRKDAVDAEIVEKLREEYTEYVAKRKEIKNYIQNKIFMNYLRNKQQMVAVAAEKPKAVKIKTASAKAAEPVVVEEELRSAAAVETTSNQRKSARKKGGKKYKKKSRKHRKTKKYRKNKK